MITHDQTKQVCCSDLCIYFWVESMEKLKKFNIFPNHTSSREETNIYLCKLIIDKFLNRLLGMTMVP